MVIVDTNVLVRYFTDDDPQKAYQAENYCFLKKHY